MPEEQEPTPSSSLEPSPPLDRETARAVERVLPWVVSFFIHASLVLLGFLVTWTVVLLSADDKPVLIVADFNAMSYEPLLAMNPEEEMMTELLVQDRAQTESVADRVDELIDPVIDPINLLSGAPRETETARFGPDPSEAAATFVGLSTTNARRIVYVLDASGSMIRSFPVVIDELARSLDGLVPSQQFSIICFSGGRAFTVPPGTRLVSGTQAEKVRALTWVRGIIPESRSNPLAALRSAMAFEPDVIFLLSENITGSGQFEIDQRDLLALLDKLNPVNPDTDQRATQINCIQFLDPDPLGTLEEIARLHGGPNGYKFLDREELGLKAP